MNEWYQGIYIYSCSANSSVYILSLSFYILHYIILSNSIPIAYTMTDQPEASTSYRPPSKYILSPAHLAAFRRSATHEEITGFISDLNRRQDSEGCGVFRGESDAPTMLIEANTTSHRYPRHCVADRKGYPTSRQQVIPLR
jgi:hypothetical protein